MKKVIREENFSRQDGSGYGTVRVYDNGTVELDVRFSSLRVANSQAPGTCCGAGSLIWRLLREAEG